MILRETDIPHALDEARHALGVMRQYIRNPETAADIWRKVEAAFTEFEQKIMNLEEHSKEAGAIFARWREKYPDDADMAAVKDDFAALAKLIEGTP